MGLFRRRPKTFPGVQFRISTINGVIIDINSEQLYYAARYGEYCDEHGWLNLVAGGADGMQVPGSEFSVVPLKVEIKPVQIPVRVTGRDA